MVLLLVTKVSLAAEYFIIGMSLLSRFCCVPSDVNKDVNKIKPELLHNEYCNHDGGIDDMNCLICGFTSFSLLCFVRFK